MAQKFPLRPVLASEVPGGGLRSRAPWQAEGEKARRGVPNTLCALKPPNETLQEANDKLFSIPMTGDTVRTRVSSFGKGTKMENLESVSNSCSSQDAGKATDYNLRLRDVIINRLERISERGKQQVLEYIQELLKQGRAAVGIRSAPGEALQLAVGRRHG